MKKNAPTMREVNAAEDALKTKIRSRSSEGLVEPTWEETQEWKRKHPTPSDVFARKVNDNRDKLQKSADEIILAGKMGQVTSEEFYNAVKSF